MPRPISTPYSRRRGSSAEATELHRLEIRGQNDLQHFAIVRVTQHRVLDARGLDPAAARLHRDRALPLELRRHPALEHVDHLKIDLVVVQLRDFLGPKGRQQADHVGLDEPVGRLGQAQVAVLRVPTQAIRPEILFPEMTHRETLRRRRRALRRGIPLDAFPRLLSIARRLHFGHDGSLLVQGKSVRPGCGARNTAVAWHATSML